MIREGLELSQNLILWKMKCPRERKEVDSHLEWNLVSLFELHFFPTLLGEWNIFLLLSFSSFIIILEKIAPLSLADMILKSLEFRDGKTSMR